MKTKSANIVCMIYLEIKWEFCPRIKFLITNQVDDPLNNDSVHVCCYCEAVSEVNCLIACNSPVFKQRSTYFFCISPLVQPVNLLQTCYGFYVWIIRLARVFLHNGIILNYTCIQQTILIYLNIFLYVFIKFIYVLDIFLYFIMIIYQNTFTHDINASISSVW